MQASVGKRDLSHKDDNSCIPNKTCKVDITVDERLSEFLSWCTSEGLYISEKVFVSRRGSCAQYGMLTSSPVAVGETLFEIPRRLLLTPKTSSISELLSGEKASLESESGWVPILLCLMHETTSSDSRWKPYLDLVPDYQELDLPMFWNKDELAKLNGTGVVDAVEHDLKSIENEFNTIVLPFVNKHPSVFPSVCTDLAYYKRAVAFVMAYSFAERMKDIDSESSWDSADEHKGPPIMVPMADILNHVANNNARLNFGVESLKMVATRPIDEGEEVFNTYGELANWQLLHMYGFAESPSDNHYDALELPMSRVRDIIVSSFETEQQQFALKKWNFLQKVGAVSDDGAYVLGVRGFLTEEEMYETLKVMVMDEVSFRHHEEKEGWSDDDASTDDGQKWLTFRNVASSPESWKVLLEKTARAFLQLYDHTVSDSSAEEDTLLQRRHRFVDDVKRGQIELLTRLLQACQMSNGDDSAFPVTANEIASVQS